MAREVARREVEVLLQEAELRFRHFIERGEDREAIPLVNDLIQTSGSAQDTRPRTIHQIPPARRSRAPVTIAAKPAADSPCQPMTTS